MRRPGPSTTPATATADPLLARQTARESAARTYSRRLPLALVHGAGVEVRDSAGRTYIDCLAGAGALALGHHHPVVVDALQSALADGVPLTTLDLTTPLKDAFVEELFAALPASLAAAGRIQFCGPTGADAVEAAVKLARTATGRGGIVSFGGAYHGMTHGTLALSGAHAPKTPLGTLADDVQHLPFPTALRCPFGVGGEAGAALCARTLRWLLEDDHSGTPKPAAVILEPVQGEGGVQPAPTSFLREVRALTRAHGVVLIADEVQTGLGRTGRLWASDRGLDPDILVLSKAIGGGLPLAVIVYREELDVWAPGAHAGTFRGNQLAMAAGAATIRHVAAERLDVQADRVGSALMDGLRSAAAGCEAVADVRGRGLMIGIELVDPARTDADGVPVPDGERASALQQAMLERGVIVEVGGRGAATVRLLPPLILEAAHAERIVDAFAASLPA
ncbi:Diaminobutyrate--2-oxoglutarate aminotransferase [Paraconexibacter sp. AEG42_29]|uniref:Diaminobutyrate--2-oxoglutarate transaminase n=1 Tax=Paraconexibacter sp. AEG42_29 TaxID=2997339 RepID=A0AAU7B2E8_9ACTN